MRTSFVLHLDSLCILEKLTPEQRGNFIYAIYYYQLNGSLPPQTDLLLELVITPFINQFKRDEEKYSAIVQRNKNNGSKGGRPVKNQRNKPKKPSGLFGNPDNPSEPKKPKLTNSDSDSVNDSISDNDNDKDISTGEKPPVVDEGKIWSSCVKAWFDFYGENFKTEEMEPAKPKFKAQECDNLKKIISYIKKGTEEKNKVQWGEQTAHDNCKLFFKRAFEKSEWLKNHFELKNLVSEYNSITNTPKTDKNGKEHAGTSKGTGIKVRKNNF